MFRNERALRLSKKVLEEIESTKEFLENRSIYWSRQLSDAYCLALSDESKRDLLTGIEEMYDGEYILDAVSGLERRNGEPLELVDLDISDKEGYEFEFNKVKLYDIRYNNAIMEILFSNDGSIELTRKALRKSNVNYTISFNVMSPSVSIDINQGECLVSLEEDKIIERNDNIEIIKELSDNLTTVKIENKYNNVSVIYHAQQHSDGSLLYDGVEIIIPSENKHYQFTVDEFNSNWDSLDIDEVVKSSVSVKFSYNKTGYFKVDENIGIVNQSELDIKNKLMSIENEIPIPSLVARIENILKMMETLENQGIKYYKKVANN